MRGRERRRKGPRKGSPLIKSNGNSSLKTDTLLCFASLLPPDQELRGREEGGMNVAIAL